MKEYLFLRLTYAPVDEITDVLNDHAGFGWSVVAHADDGGSEWTFVLERERGQFRDVPMKAESPS